MRVQTAECDCTRLRTSPESDEIELSEAAMMAPPPRSLARTAATCPPGCHWLSRAVEMAATVSDGWTEASVAGSSGFPRVATRTPGVGADCVRAARYFTDATLARWEVADRRDDIVTVVSELLTNALRHTLPGPGMSGPHRPIRLGLLQPGPSVMCAVADPSSQLPAPTDPDCFEECGRGLHVIASLSDDW